MAREFASAVRFAPVATLPAAASNPGVVLEHANKLWFSNGATWEDLGAAGGGGGAPTPTSASYAYTAGVLTSATEVFDVAPDRVTTYTYTAGVLTQAQSIRGSTTITTTYSYTAGVLTGFTIT